MNAKENVEQLFGELIQLETKEERERFLRDRCDGNPDIRAQLEKLLTAHENAGSFLCGESTLDQQPDITTSEIGPYKLLQKLGEGGMGIVYMAEQKEPVKRRVALKIIKPGMDSKQVLARFEAERQALAMMDHPNIAKVLEAGTTNEGLPYFVMELVKGFPITEYCDEHELTTEQRLKLFTDVCQAVQHAHQKGVIHRDLKPSNILVAEYDNRVIPKVIDFGVAKALSQQLTERTMFTQYGQIIGTFEYMSPEQAKVNQLDVDTRSDIYSLGVLLYELFTGTTPIGKQRLHSAAFDELVRIVREEEPLRPSAKLSTIATIADVASKRRTDPKKLSHVLRGDLDWIVMKALDKERGRRYATASALADDVGRYLQSEPVVACPPTATYRFWKFVRRYRSRVLVTSAAVTMLVVGAGLWGLEFTNRKAAETASRAALHDLRFTLYERGVDCVLSGRSSDAAEMVDSLEAAEARDLAIKLRAIRALHEQDYPHSIELLLPAIQKNPQDAGLRALLTDAYDGAGQIHNWFESLQRLRSLDLEQLHVVDRVYAALAFIAEPRKGAELADQAVQTRPTSPIARLIRGRMKANYGLASTAAGDLTQKSTDDIRSAEWLLGLDHRIPSQSLAAHLMNASVAQRRGDSDWRQHLDFAETVANFVKSRGGRSWELFFLAQYEYEGRFAADCVDRARSLYQQLHTEYSNDYAANFYFALCHELDETPDTMLVDSLEKQVAGAFGTAGYGYLLAVNGEHAEASKHAQRLAESGTVVDTLLLACDIMNLNGDLDAARELARDNLARMSEPDFPASHDWVRECLLPYYAGTVSEEELIASLDGSEYDYSFACYGSWAIATRSIGQGDWKTARSALDKCVETRVFYLHPYPWARALTKKLAIHRASAEERAEDVP